MNCRRFFQVALFSGASLLVLFQFGCATPPNVAKPDDVHRVDTSYQPGDKVVIDFADNQGLPNQWQQAVREDGTITLPLNQTVKAAGKRKGELEEEIRKLYVPKILKRLTVNVRPQQQSYFVRGEVKTPGQKEHTGLITALKAIATAGDFTDFADRSDVEIIRGSTGERIKVNAKDAIKNPNLDVPVYPGDTVHVSRRYF
jgi:polysaccharide biosynthesis/export protein